MFKKKCRFFRCVSSFMHAVDFAPALALRLYLVPIFWSAGAEKLLHIQQTAAWFGNPDWGLGLPFAHFLAYLVGGVEVAGAVLLLMGLGVPWIAVPLSLIMIGAVLTVHGQHGWPAIAGHASDATQRLQEVMNWLQSNHPQRYEYLTAFGRPVMLNNGAEYAITYLIMLMSLCFGGAGRYVSLDYWIARIVARRSA